MSIKVIKKDSIIANVLKRIRENPRQEQTCPVLVKNRISLADITIQNSSHNIRNQKVISKADAIKRLWK